MTGRDAAAPAPDRRLAAKAIAVTVVAALVYAGFAAFSDARALAAAVASFRPVFALAALALVLTGYALRALRWHAYLRHLDVRLPWRESALLFLGGLSMGVTPGKMGEAVKAYHLRARHGTPYVASLPAVLAERLTDAAAVALLLAAGLLLVRVPGGALWSALVVAGVLAVVALVRWRGVGALLGRISPRLAEAHAHLRPMMTGGLLAGTMALGIAAWSLEAAAMATLARGFGLDLSLAQSAFVFAAGSLAGVLSLLPGGLGVAEGGMVALLGWLGVALPAATALTLATRLATLWLGVAVGSLALLALHRRRPAA